MQVGVNLQLIAQAAAFEQRGLGAIGAPQPLHGN